MPRSYLKLAVCGALAVVCASPAPIAAQRPGSARFQAPPRGAPGFRPPPLVSNPMVVGNPNDPSMMQRRRDFFRRQTALLFRQQALTQMALQQAAMQQALTASIMGQMAYASPMMSESYAMPNIKNQVRLNVAVNAGAGDVVGAAFLAGLVDERGQIAWPLGLQILPPALESKALRQRIEGLVRVAAQQTAKGAPIAVGNELSQAIAQLSVSLEKHRADMPERTGRDAAAFLVRLQSIAPAAQAGY